MDQLLKRMLGAAKLQSATYEEVEADKGATTQAALIVAVVSIATGFGVLGTSGPVGFLYGVLLGLFGWALFAGLAYWIGTNFLAKPETHADWGQVARGLGFARTPGVLYLLGLLGFIGEGLGALIMLAVTVWIIVASIVALRAALDYGDDWVRAAVVAVLAYIPYIIIQAIVSTVL